LVSWLGIFFYKLSCELSLFPGREPRFARTHDILDHFLSVTPWDYPRLAIANLHARVATSGYLNYDRLRLGQDPLSVENHGCHREASYAKEAVAPEH
jgi:hypothetical protein